jgi:NAD-dependent SIR2 family protein deacetylase
MSKVVTGECLNCESSYEVAYVEQLTSTELPEHCPFCGEIIDEITENYIDEDEQDLTDDDLKWE